MPPPCIDVWFFPTEYIQRVDDLSASPSASLLPKWPQSHNCGWDRIQEPATLFGCPRCIQELKDISHLLLLFQVQYRQLDQYWGLRFLSAHMGCGCYSCCLTHCATGWRWNVWRDHCPGGQGLWTIKSLDVHFILIIFYFCCCCCF